MTVHFWECPKCGKRNTYYMMECAFCDYKRYYNGEPD